MFVRKKEFSLFAREKKKKEREKEIFFLFKREAYMS